MKRTFAVKLANYLESESISQDAFGKLLGVTQGAVSQWLLGKTYPSFAHSIKIEAITKGKLTRVNCRPDIENFLGATWAFDIAITFPIVEHLNIVPSSPAPPPPPRRWGVFYVALLTRTRAFVQAKLSAIRERIDEQWIRVREQAQWKR